MSSFRMPRLADLPLATKLLSSVIALALLAIGLSWGGLRTMADMHDVIETARRDTLRLEASGRANANLLAYVRNIEFLPIEMEAPRRAQFEAAAADELRRLRVRLDQLQASTVTELGRTDLAATRAKLAQYEEVAGRIQVISRAGRYDEAGRIAFDAAAIVDEVRTPLRRIESRMHDRIEARATEAGANYAWTHTVFTFGAVGGILVIGGLAIWITLGGVVRPLRRLTATVETIAHGQLDTEVPGQGRRDELGRLADAVLTLRDNSRRAKELEAAAEAQKAADAAERRRARRETADSFDASVGAVVQRLAAEAEELQQAAGRLAAAADRSSDGASEAAMGAQQASGNVQQVAAAAEELTVSVSEITRQVAQAADVARRAVARTSETDASVQSLADGARRIEDVVRLISDVAGQTNLLALNATIEAARAGEAGKGFAVVASEVKNLAAQTARATEEIAQQIAAIQSATGEAVNAIRGIGGVVAEVDEIATAIAAAVEEQGAATREIARNIAEAAEGTGNVSLSLGGVREATGETSAAVTALRQVGSNVAQHSANLQAEVSTVLAQLRA